MIIARATHIFLCGAPGTALPHILTLGRSRSGSFVLTYGDPEDDELVLSVELSGPDDWRTVVERIGNLTCPNDDMPADEVVTCHELSFEGEVRWPFELMALAIVGDGPCLPGLQLLSHASDAQLTALKERFESLTAPAFVRFLERLVWLDERLEGRMGQALGRLARAGLPITSRSLADVVRVLRRLARAEERVRRAREALRSVEREWTLYPWQQAVDAVVRAWEELDTWSYRGTFTAAAVRARAQALRTWLECRILRTGRLPSGRATVVADRPSGPMRVTPDPFEVNLDLLRARAGLEAEIRRGDGDAGADRSGTRSDEPT